MTEAFGITGRLIAAARALTGVGQQDFAAAAQLPVDRLQLLENAGSAWISEPVDRLAILRALDHFGVVVIPESDGMGAGIRLNFTRQDVRQLARLEGEGGAIGSDDAP